MASSEEVWLSFQMLIIGPSMEPRHVGQTVAGSQMSWHPDVKRGLWVSFVPAQMPAFI